MTPSISRLRSWSPDQLRACETAVIETGRRVESLRLEAGRAVDAIDGLWRGQGASAAAEHWAATSRLTARVCAAARVVADRYGESAASIGSARRTLLDLVDEAVRVRGMTVADDGTVDPPSPEPADADAAEDFQRRIAEALDAAELADGRAADALRNAFADLARAPEERSAELSRTVRDILDGRALFPHEPADAGALWATLSTADKNALAAWDPTIGNRDGLPAVDRDFYNRKLLRDLESSPDPTVAAAHAAVSNELGPDTFLLTLNDGHAAIAVGNPDTADNVATFVPGTGSTLLGVGADLRRTRAMYDAALTAAPTETTSTILWSGYDAPPTVAAARWDHYAESAVRDLDSFHDGLRASHDGPPSHTVAIGHSYGSTVIGAASTGAESLDVDDLLFVASPGVDVDRATDLRVGDAEGQDAARHVHATTAFWDPVRLIPQTLGVHGFDPADPAFGAQVFTSLPGAPGLEVHSDYWKTGNPALSEMGRIIAGP